MTESVSHRNYVVNRSARWITPLAGICYTPGTHDSGYVGNQLAKSGYVGTNYG